MRSLRFYMLTSALWMGLVGGVLAATISERVDIAQRRIEQGVRSRALTRDEARALREEFFRVRHDEQRAKADGRLDRRERDRLDRELDRLERHISRLKDNDSSQRGYRDNRGRN